MPECRSIPRTRAQRGPQGCVAARPGVGVELGCALDEVCEVAVGQVDPVRRAVVGRRLDVVLGDLVADAARTGVQEQPDAVVLVEGDLDEVVARAQRAEL